MTYKQLAKQILALPEDRQNDDISVLLMNQGEVLEIIDFVTGWTEEDAAYDYDKKTNWGLDFVDGVLDEGHAFITVDF